MKVLCIYFKGKGLGNEGVAAEGCDICSLEDVGRSEGVEVGACLVKPDIFFMLGFVFS